MFWSDGNTLPHSSDALKYRSKRDRLSNRWKTGPKPMRPLAAAVWGHCVQEIQPGGALYVAPRYPALALWRSQWMSRPRKVKPTFAHTDSWPGYSSDRSMLWRRAAFRKDMPSVAACCIIDKYPCCLAVSWESMCDKSLRSLGGNAARLHR